MKIGPKRAVFDCIICFATTNHSCRDLVILALLCFINFRPAFTKSGKFTFISFKKYYWR